MVQLAALLTRPAPEPLGILAGSSLDGITIFVLALLAAFLLVIVWANRPSVMRRYSGREPEAAGSAPEETRPRTGAREGGAARADGSKKP